MRNRINDEYRRLAHLTDDEITDLCMRPVAEADEFQREYMERQQTLITSVMAGFSKLSPRQKQIITLYYLEQRKYNDICQIMGINYQSVRNLMHRSICRLREYASRVD